MRWATGLLLALLLASAGAAAAAPAARPPAPPADPRAELARRLDEGQLPAALQLLHRHTLDPRQLSPAVRYTLAVARIAQGGEPRQQGLALLRTLLLPEPAAAEQPGPPAPDQAAADPSPAAASTPPGPSSDGQPAFASLARARLAEAAERAGDPARALKLLEELDGPDGTGTVPRLVTATLRARLLRALSRPEALLEFGAQVQPLLWQPAAQSELLEQRLWAARSRQRPELATALAEQLLRDYPQSPEAQRVLQQQGLLRRLAQRVDHPAGREPAACTEPQLARIVTGAAPAEQEQVRGWLGYLRGACRLAEKSWGPAQEAFDRALAEPGNAAQEARLLLGRAVSLRRRDFDLEAAAAYRLLAVRHPEDPLAAPALAEAVGLDRLSGEGGLAALDVQLLLATPPAGPLLPWARWTQAWLELRAGRKAEAARLLERLGQQHPQAASLARGGLAAQAGYWEARARAAQGQQEEAAELWADLATRFPLTYYSHLALAQLAATAPERAAKLRRPALAAGDGVQAAALPLRARPELAAVLAFEEAGMSRAAVRELRDLLRAGRLEPPEVDHLAALLAESGDVTGAYFTERFRGTFDRFPEDGTLARWQLAHPRPFRELVERFAAAEKIDPLLVWSVMRQESAFTPGVRSPAGAIGLMQLMPDTARLVARQLGKRVRDADLYRPETSIQLASHLLHELLDLYGGNVMMVAAAYNAGPGNVRRWRDRWPGLDNDAWAEEIPIREAHAYVKQVTEALGVYHHLYGQPEGSWAPTLLFSGATPAPAAG